MYWLDAQYAVSVSRWLLAVQSMMGPHEGDVKAHFTVKIYIEYFPIELLAIVLKIASALFIIIIYYLIIIKWYYYPAALSPSCGRHEHNIRDVQHCTVLYHQFSHCTLTFLLLPSFFPVLLTSNFFTFKSGLHTMKSSP